MNQFVEQKLEICPLSGESQIEELANSITHGFGLLLSIFGAAYLIVIANLYYSPLIMASCIIYGSSLVLLYAASTCYHSSRSLQGKRILRIIDHVCIYLLIAGTYTPYIFGPLKETYGWALFAIIWGTALIGILLKLIGSNTSDFVSALPYLLMGWLALTVIVPLFNNLSTEGFVWLVAGGLVYSLGTIFFLLKKLPFNHSIWHLFVLGGSICHYTSIIGHVVPYNIP